METPQNQQQNPKKLDRAALVSLSFELGYIIALPLVIFGLLGKWVDHRLNHSFPWVTLIGIGLAIASTVIWLTNTIKKYIK